MIIFKSSTSQVNEKLSNFSTRLRNMSNNRCDRQSHVSNQVSGKLVESSKHLNFPTNNYDIPNENHNPNIKWKVQFS